MLPFNSTFFAVAQQPVHGRPLTVQPVTLAYTGFRNLPMSRCQRPIVAWYGNMGMFGHLWQLMGQGSIRADVWLHKPVTLENYGSRKALARACEDTVADGLVYPARRPHPQFTPICRYPMTGRDISAILRMPPRGNRSRNITRSAQNPRNPGKSHFFSSDFHQNATIATCLT